MFDNDKAPLMVRSEEVLRIRTETVPMRRARLQRVIVTETKTFTVEVRREEVRLVIEPLAAGEVAPPGARPAYIEMVLHEERVVVTKEVVPVERVRLVRETVTGTTTVTADLRTEQVALGGVGDIHTPDAAEPGPAPTPPAPRTSSAPRRPPASRTPPAPRTPPTPRTPPMQRRDDHV